MNQTVRDELEQLAIQAQQHPPYSSERQIALTKLVNGIVRSGRLCHPQRSQFSAAIYEDIYNEALQEMLLYICQNINKYDPERASVMAWVNVLLERRFFKEAIPRILDNQGITKMSITDLDNLASPEESPDLAQALKDCIESDPEDIFKNEHIEKYPQANFQALARRRFLGKPWKEISEEFGLKISTISSFYYRCINKYSLKFKEYLMS